MRRIPSPGRFGICSFALPSGPSLIGTTFGAASGAMANHVAPAPASPARGNAERSSAASYPLPTPRGLRPESPQAGKLMNECRSAFCFHLILALPAARAHCLEKAILAVRPDALAIARRYRQPAREIVRDRHDSARGGLCLVRCHFDESRPAVLCLDHSSRRISAERNPGKCSPARDRAQFLAKRSQAAPSSS